MAPNLKDIKDISSRISCFGLNNKGQESVDNGKPSQAPNSTMAKQSSNPIQSKSHGPRNQQFATLPKKDNSNLQIPSQNPFVPGYAPGYAPASSSKPSAQLLNPFLLAQPGSVVSLKAMALGNPPAGKKSTNKHPIGSFFTQIDSSGSIHPHKSYSSMASHSHSGSSQGQGTSTNKHPASFSWFPPYPEGPSHLHTQPAPPLASSDASGSSWVPVPSHFAGASPMHHMHQPHPLLGNHPLVPLAEHPQHLHLGAGSEQTPMLNNQPGLMYNQQIPEDYYPIPIPFHAMPEFIPLNQFGEMFSPYQPPGQGSQSEKMEIDGLSLEDNSEDSDEDSAESPDIEQPPENIAMIEETLADLKPLGLFVQGLVNHACAECHKKKTMGPEDVINMTATWTGDNGGKVSLGLKCQEKSCPVVTCLGCGKAIHSTMTNGSGVTLKVAEMNTTVQWCCDDGRLAAIWALACGWKAPKSKSESKSRANYVLKRVRGKVKIKEATVLDKIRGPRSPAPGNGVGYGEGSVPHSSFFGQFGQYRNHPKQSIQKRTIDIKENPTHEIHFRLLALLLPSCKRVAPFDASPPSLLSHIISRSPLLEHSAMMLSNGSIDEISSRSQLHDSVLDFFDALGSHPATANLVYTDRTLYYEDGGNLLEASLSPEKSKGRIVPRDTGKPLIELLGSMATQLQTLLRYAKGTPIGFQGSEGQKLLKLSQRVSEISTRHVANMQQLQTAMDVIEDKPDINFSEWHRENCVRDVPDDAVLRNFAYAQEARRDGPLFPERGRMKRLVTEITTLMSSLPEGIFVCHGSSRLDIMKVLIIGPRQTPYEHGLFEFDLFCPFDYPNSPPKVLFKTPNTSKGRFNPNLYHDGKICLSLLNTWHGEPWRGDQSTLLQVLVSIQAMIFCEEPWYNEPGRERVKEKRQSDTYNIFVRSITMQFAQLPWVKTIKADDTTQDLASGTSAMSLWKETARLYLRANTKDILDTIKVASKSSSSTQQDIARNLKTALKASGYLD
ncbi:hypothetical protein F5Y00DRAFT_254094 [Daldinia vernicosa]|uniref:uncharacterized protein n=1 Tax=Daldinia vernicosa TaxID=114800 RepID=UPI002008538D|nr:uncharacterized protein F5Y00DRAFT_254094 [Daldinia vernicosa]KAI0847162.1 hypothetical protein F5Y00DRAFT_254094 [Daldinia vernicosa]